MTVQITLAVPDTVYQQVEQVAKTTRRPVSDLMLEAVTRSFSAFYVDENRDQMEHEVAAFEIMHSELWKSYANQYVAIYQGQVIDSDSDEIALLDRLDVIHPDDVVLVRQVLEQIQGDLHFRSPRFVRENA